MRKSILILLVVFIVMLVAGVAFILNHYLNDGSETLACVGAFLIGSCIYGFYWIVQNK